MALLTILEYPDPRLKKVAAPVTAFTPDLVKLVRDMAETMYAAPGVGLAATQVDVHKRVIVIESRGGLYSEGPAQAIDFQEPYLRHLLGFMGLADVAFIHAEKIGASGSAKGMPHG